jgi:hypothetical protein
MVALLLAAAVAPWAHPLAFCPMAGWDTGASGNTRSVYVRNGTWLRQPLESAAWIAKHVRHRDPATADPPNTTLAHMPRDAVVVWAVIFSRIKRDRPIRLELSRARRHACCEGAYVAGGEYELTGFGGGGAYSVIVRIYFGSAPTVSLRAEAQRALNHLRLPPA